MRDPAFHGAENSITGRSTYASWRETSKHAPPLHRPSPCHTEKQGRSGPWTGGSGSGGGGGTTSGYTPVPYTAGGDAANYNIRIKFKGSWTAELYNGFTAAAALLCTYISGDLPNVLFSGKAHCGSWSGNE
jgi:hypothetical protein